MTMTGTGVLPAAAGTGTGVLPAAAGTGTRGFPQGRGMSAEYVFDDISYWNDPF